MNSQLEIKSGDHFRGSRNSPITMIEYGDFQCPYCTKAFEEIERTLIEFQDSVCFVYRNFPLREVHLGAELAARCAEAAALQDAFWPMHRLLYRDFQKLMAKGPEALAKDLDLDLAKFRRDIASEKVIAKVQSDLQSGIDVGLEGTPTVFVNGERFHYAATYKALSNAFTEILQSKAAAQLGNELS
jgi:protein-disulfide isomerase